MHRIRINGKNISAEREIEGEKKLICTLPIVIAGQKGLVEESELLIPNERNNDSTNKTSKIVTKSNEERTERLFRKTRKSYCKLVEAGNEAELVNLLHNEAKAI